MSLQELDSLNGRLLELFIHCIADSLSQRRDLIQNLSLFSKTHIVVACRADLKTPATESTNGEDAKHPLLKGLQLISETNEKSIKAETYVNLARVQSALDKCQDASFECECAREAINGLSDLLGVAVDKNVINAIETTKKKKPRFILGRFLRKMDVPQFCTPIIPKPTHFKTARRDLAIILKNLGTTPGRYELKEAKAIIDPARDALRAQIHSNITNFDVKSLARFCIEQHDALSAKYQTEIFRVRQSLKHEVNYDRSSAVADSHEEFTSNARNYRYLLECCLSTQSQGSGPISEDAILQTLASIDWLFVLYGASDVLHNEIDVGGIDLDSSYIPEIFYSTDRSDSEKQFAREMADAQIGKDLSADDEVVSDQEQHFGAVDKAFTTDVGFSFSHLLLALSMLAQWQTHHGANDMHLSYEALKDEVSVAFVESTPNLSKDSADKILNFIVLDKNNVRRLLGRASEAPEESDVPVWEHTKRGNRYNIKPVIESGDSGHVLWGAAAASKASIIWRESIANGYLPADYDWPNVKIAVRAIKEGIEKQLEKRAFEICGRSSQYVVSGMDFNKRFPQEKFEDVGDFDVLAYWPSSNQWLAVECKYNQPPFCIKDARRLRERIFGRGENREQFSKIERRRAFLATNRDKLRALLGWPISTSNEPISYTEVYVCRDIYWWMRNPPYEVPTHFVRIDQLDNWLRKRGLLQN